MGRLRRCGREGVLPGGSVRVRASGAGSDRRSGFAGVATCGSVWSCPVCSAKILGHRSAELAEGLQRWADGGGAVVMVTLTMRHHAGQSLAQLWDGLSVAWDRVVKGRPWRRLRDAHGVAGYVRAVEVTHGAHGWHVHLHVGLFVRSPLALDAVESIRAQMFTPWRAGLVAQGLGVPLERASDAVQWDGRSLGRFGEYVTKLTYDDGATTAALELARGDLKAARSGNRTPFRVLSDIGAFGLVDDVELWQEWERTSKGRRQMTWSRGMRDLLGYGAELTDEQLAEQQEGTADDDLVEFPADAWRLVTSAGLRGIVLDLAEDDASGDALRRYLTARGVTFVDVRPRVPV